MRNKFNLPSTIFIYIDIAMVSTNLSKLISSICNFLNFVPLISYIFLASKLKHFPVPKPNPLEAVKFRLEQMNMSETQLSDILGNRSRKSQIPSGRRKRIILFN